MTFFIGWGGEKGTIPMTPIEVGEGISVQARGTGTENAFSAKIPKREKSSPPLSSFGNVYFRSGRRKIARQGETQSVGDQSIGSCKSNSNFGTRETSLLGAGGRARGSR